MARQLEITQPFDLALSLTMGQAFRWRRLPADYCADGSDWFSGVIGDHLIHIRQTDGGVEYRVGGADGETDADLSALLSSYFRLDDDIAAIYGDLAARDPKLASIIQESPGLRLLRQDPWECLVAYLCSANNNVDRIGAIVEAMADNFGAPVSLDGKARRTFPTAEQLSANPKASEAKLYELRLGLKRAPNIIAAARQVCSGDLDWDALRQEPYDKVRRRLRKCSGVGPKIAECVALFAVDQLAAFPVDRWVWRAITEAYPEWGFPEQSGPEQSGDAVIKRAQSEFGKYAGYANQQLFQWRRQHGEAPLPFGTRWRGKFQSLDDVALDAIRYEYLSRKYLSC